MRRDFYRTDFQISLKRIDGSTDIGNVTLDPPICGLGAFGPGLRPGGGRDPVLLSLFLLLSLTSL